MTGRPPPGPAVPPTPALTPAWPERAAWGTAPLLRAWQTAALTDYVERAPRDFLAVATPGAGKTTFALSAAAELLGRRIVDRIVVVAPTEHLKLQWAEAGVPAIHPAPRPAPRRADPAGGPRQRRPHSPAATPTPTTAN